MSRLALQASAAMFRIEELGTGVLSLMGVKSGRSSVFRLIEILNSKVTIIDRCMVVASSNSIKIYNACVP